MKLLHFSPAAQTASFSFTQFGLHAAAWNSILRLTLQMYC